MVQASLGTSKTTDIVKWWSGKKLQALAATGNLTDLTPVWDKAVAKGWLDDGLRASYTYQGKVWGLPIYQSYWVVFYNKSLFAKYNLTVPTTYAQFTADAATLKQNGVDAIWTGQADGWPSFIPYQTLVAGQSPAFYNELTSGKASFTDPVSQNAMKLWQTWITSGWTTPADSKLGDAPALMKAGKVAMLPIGTWENGSLKSAGMTPGTDYDAFLMPTVTPGVQPSVFIEGGAWTIPKRAPDHAAAVEQLSNWLDPTVQGVWSSFLGDTSPDPKVPITDPVLQSVHSQLTTIKPTLLNRYYESLPSNLVESSISALDGFMVHPETGSSVLAAIQASAVTEWADFNKSTG